MDPLVDAYSKLNADKGEMIDPAVSEQAITVPYYTLFALTVFGYMTA